jgi:hypothetical protein
VREGCMGSAGRARHVGALGGVGSQIVDTPSLIGEPGFTGVGLRLQSSHFLMRCDLLVLVVASGGASAAGSGGNDSVYHDGARADDALIRPEA